MLCCGSCDTRRMPTNIRREAEAAGLHPVTFFNRLRKTRTCASVGGSYLDIRVRRARHGARCVGRCACRHPARTQRSRICASLLHALQPPELVVASLAEYEEVAVQLASDPARLAALRTRLWHHRYTAASFFLSFLIVCSFPRVSVNFTFCVWFVYLVAL